jgi:outer membrane protein assembly factor BamE
MLDDGEAALFRYLVLAPFDFGVGKFLDAAALQADQMIVVFAILEFEDRLAGFEMVALQQSRLLELGKHAIHRGEADIDVFGQQLTVDILGGEMTRRRLAEQVEDGHARHGCFETNILEFGAFGHDAGLWSVFVPGSGCPYDIVFRTISSPTRLLATPHMLLRPTFPSLLLLAACLGACSNTPDITSRLSPYRIDVRQGNYVTQDMIARLKPGMSRDQVRFALGTPLVADMFHADRWDYVYRFQPGRGEAQVRRIVVFFEEGKLTRVGGDVVAETAESATAAAAPAPAARIIEVPAEPKKD